MAQLRAPKPKNMLVCIIAAICAVLLAFAVLALRNRTGFVVKKEEAFQESVSQEASADGQTQSGGASTEQAESAASVVIVHIDGAVTSPGVYSLQIDDRVQALVEAAGGLTQDADTSNINLAAKLTDGQKIHVPYVGEAQSDNESSVVSANNEASGQASGFVNINTATIDELDTLPGVGPSTAATIVQDRETLGPFSSVDDLMRVTGIGEKKFAKLKDYICV